MFIVLFLSTTYNTMVWSINIFPFFFGYKWNPYMNLEKGRRNSRREKCDQFHWMHQTKNPLIQC